eukprot:11163083-Lingulodinium_polyedra.AAC.1
MQNVNNLLCLDRLCDGDSDDTGNWRCNRRATQNREISATLANAERFWKKSSTKPMPVSWACILNES